MDRRRYLQAVAGGALAAASGCLKFSEQTDDAERVETVDHEWYDGDDGSGVLGTVRNVGEAEVDYVELVAVFMDEDGEVLWRGSDVDRDLPPGEEWSFDVAYRGDESPGAVADYELELDTTPDE